MDVILKDVLTKEHVQIVSGKGLGWEDAIKKASQPLIEDDSIGQSYIDAMIANVNKNGPYINIGDSIALAHARPEDGLVNQTGVALMVVHPEVDLVDETHPITLFFVLAAHDATSHMGALQELSEKLMNDETLQALKKSTTTDEVMNIMFGN